jgi:hypothetical protein
MKLILASLWLVVHALASVPVLVLWVQCLLARMPASRPHESPARTTRIAVLVPAHNESRGILPTLESLVRELRAGDRIVVIADNCNDDTVTVARGFATPAGGATIEAVERSDTSRRGKGYALDHGMKHLDADAPEHVLVCDADCIVEPGAIERLWATCTRSGRPTQALYLMEAPQGAKLNQRFAAFAWRLKNQARALGSLALGAPCQLMGTGMLFPWKALRAAALASGHTVEEVKMGIDLGLQGTPPLFEPLARVTSWFPSSEEGAQSQRARWEHGHMATLLEAGPKLVLQGIARGRASLVAMGLDLLVPPLALLLLGLVGLFVVDLGVAWFFGAWWVAAWSALLLALMAWAVIGAWRRFGAGTVTAGEMGMAVVYALRKIPLYAAFFVKRQTEWVRTKRDKD